MSIAKPRVAFGDLLRGYREQRGLSQEELAQGAAPPLSTETVSNLERGRTRPYRHTVEALCRALGLDDAARASVWTAWQVLVPVSAASVPTQLADQAVGNVPLQATRLIGRERELEELTRRMSDSDTRLLTLVGPGGVGKTRLAVAVAAALESQFAQGIFFVDLSALRDPKLVLSPFVRVLGVRVDGQSLQDSLISELRHGRVLLVVDNFEQLLEAAAGMSELVAACPGLTLLVTSREPLGLRWEHVFPVLPLALPTQQQSIGLDALGEVPSVALFVERAQAADATFTLNPSNAAEVSAVCATVDGLPLAIELAAARVRALPPRVLLAHLDQRLDLLTRPRDAPGRHHSMRTTLDWSYELLGAAERTVLRRLGIFAGGANLGAIAAVCMPEEGTHPLATVAGLIDKSLVLHDTWSAAEPRYRLLETVRTYALDQLTDAGERDDTAERHAHYFLGLAEQADADSVAHLGRLDREHENMRAALSWLVQSGNAERSQRLATALVELWSTRGDLNEGRYWLSAVLLLSGGGSPLLRARALNAAGRLAWLSHDCCGTDAVARPSAGALHQDALTLARAADDAPTIADALGGLGLVALADGDLTNARAWFEQALQLSQAYGLDRTIAMAQRGLGRVALEQADLNVAEPYLRASLSAAQHSKQVDEAAGTLYELGMLAFQRGDTRLARTCFEESLDVIEVLNDRAKVASVRLCLGIVALRDGDFGPALDHMVSSLGLSKASRDEHAIADVLDALACLAAARGDVDRAMRVYGAAQAQREKVGLRRSAFKQASVDAWLGNQLSHAGGLLAIGRAMPLERAVELALAIGDVSS